MESKLGQWNADFAHRKRNMHWEPNITPVKTL